MKGINFLKQINKKKEHQILNKLTQLKTILSQSKNNKKKMIKL